MKLEFLKKKKSQRAKSEEQGLVNVLQFESAQPVTATEAQVPFQAEFDINDAPQTKIF